MAGNAQETAGDARLDSRESLSLGYKFQSPSVKLIAEVLSVDEKTAKVEP